LSYKQRMFFRIATICLILICCLASTFCYQHNTIRCIVLRQNYPVFNKQRKVENYIDFNNRLFYFGQMVMVQLNYMYDSMVNDKLLKSETRYRYLVYKKGDRVGNLYDEGTGKETKSVSVDSILKIEWFNNLRIYDMFKQNNLTLIAAEKDPKAGTLKEEYTIVSKNDTAQKGRCYLYYTNQLKNLDYSFSRELDSMKGMKLDSVRIINDAHFYKEGNLWIDKVVQWFKMEEDTSFDKDKIERYFSKYGSS
jgi:hypothetical protein